MEKTGDCTTGSYPLPAYGRMATARHNKVMRFKITFKDPDTLHDCIRDELENMEKPSNLTDDEFEAVLDVRKKEMEEAAAKWFKWSEYVTVEIDTEAGTAKVVPKDGE